MKRKAITGIIISMLLATAGILTSSVKSSGTETILLVTPELIEYKTPAYGKNFTMNVSVANVTDLFGYEFKLSWNTTLLDCLGADVTPPTDWGQNYVVVVNEINETSGQYWLAVTALAPASSFTGNASITRLTFKVTYDPIYPENVSSAIQLSDTILCDKNAEPIDHTTRHGEYRCFSLKPVVKVLPSEYIATAGGVTFKVEVWVFNVSNLAYFSFYLIYNATLLNASVPKIGNIFPYPYWHTTFKQVEGSSGKLGVAEGSLSPANGSGLLGTLTFTTLELAYEACCDLNLSIVELKTLENAAIPYDAIHGSYHYIPLPGDINGDHRVDMKDILIVILAYGSKLGDPNWNSLADLNRDNRIDLLDIVKVAINFGKEV